MKLKNIFGIVVLATGMLTITSCDSYLDKQPDDMQTLEGVFAKRSSTEQYLANVLAYMPAQWDILCTQYVNTAYGWPFVAVSDEAEWGAVRAYAYMQNGTLSSSNTVLNFWSSLYRGIREANIFLQHVGECRELKDGELELWTAEAEYSRAMCHYWLATLYGPIILIKDEVVDVNVVNDYRERDTWEDCVKYISDELLAVSRKLPAQQSDAYSGKPTSVAALAYRSRLLLYSASPLMNGNAYFRGYNKEDGTPLFSTTYDASKWETAAKAAKELIDMCEYQEVPSGLYTTTDEEAAKGITYKKLFQESWNKELLDARDMKDDAYTLDIGPAPLGGRFQNGHGTNCATQQQVDAYAMSNGRYPIVGYNSDGSPQIDEESGYIESGFSTFTIPTFTATVMNAPDQSGYTGEMYNMYSGREPRFYASILFNEGVWPNTITDKPVYLNKYGTEGATSQDYNRTGYLISKFVNPSTVTNTYTLGTWRRTWPNFRYAEVLLNYVEAKIEMGQLDSSVLQYWNMVRRRGGVPDIETVYPTVTSDRELATFLLRRERQVEFAFEGVRYFDANRWKIAAETNNGNAYGMNVNISSQNVLRTEFYKRTPFETRVFKERNYLQPIPQNSITKNLKLKQNPGW